MKYGYAMITVLGALVSAAVPACAFNRNVENALARQGDLSVFYQALLTTGVADELNENTEYTIFAPTNEAFTSITPRNYPCFYSVQCRAQLAAVLRNHIVPVNQSVDRFSKWGGEIPTIGNHRLDVEEPYRGQYEVDGKTVLYQSPDSEDIRRQGDAVSLYQIDGVIVSSKELAAFRELPVVNASGTVMQKTVTTTYRAVPAPASVSGWYLVPGGYPDAPLVVVPDESPNGATETTTTRTRTRTTQ